ncbi:MAG: DUF4340 domain-containing protein [Bryobacteraceae bacterium]
MKPGRLIIAAVLLAGLSGALWWSNKEEKSKEAKPASDAPPKVFNFKEDDVKQIDIKRKEGEKITTVIFDAKGKWQLTAPVAMPAESTQVASITSTAANLVADRVVDENVTDLAAYGLDQPIMELAITTKDGKKQNLRFGEPTPVGSNIYVKLDGDPRLFAIAAYNKATFDKVENEMRDKHLLDFTGGKIQKLELTAKKQITEFNKISDSDWQIVKPKTIRTDSFAVDEVVNKLKNSILDGTATEADLKRGAALYASSPLFAAVKITDSNATQSIEIHKAKDEYWVKSSALKEINRVTKEIAEPFDKSVDDFRNKKLFDFGFNDPVKVEITDNGKTATYEKQGEKWMSGGKAMDAPSVQAVIDRLRELAAVKFPESGFASPATAFTVVSNGGKKTEKVEISITGGGVIAKRADETNFFELDANIVKDLRQAASDIRAAQAEKKK